MKSCKLPVLLATGVLAVMVGGGAAGQSKPDVGVPAPLSHAHDRKITLQPGAKYVNVKRGECVEFIVDGKPFAWDFNTGDTGNFSFAEIAPDQVALAGVQVYVGQNYHDRYR